MLEEAHGFSFSAPFWVSLFSFSLCPNKECALQSKIDAGLKHFWRKSYCSWKLPNKSQGIILQLLLHICYYIPDSAWDLLVCWNVGKVRANSQHILWEKKISSWSPACGERSAGGSAVGAPPPVPLYPAGGFFECGLFSSMVSQMEKLISLPVL